MEIAHKLDGFQSVNVSVFVCVWCEKSSLEVIHPLIGPQSVLKCGAHDSSTLPLVNGVDNEPVQDSLLRLIGCILLPRNYLTHTQTHTHACFLLDNMTAKPHFSLSLSHQLICVNIHDQYMFHRTENTWLSAPIIFSRCVCLCVFMCACVCVVF